jgi:hypothetical protein
MAAKIYFLSKTPSERGFFPFLIQLPVNEVVMLMSKKDY